MLEAIQEAISASAVTIDTPPLSREQFVEITDEMKSNYGWVFKTMANLISRLDAIWESMLNLAKRENISFERLTVIITVDVVSWSRVV
ncbi:MAG TPA: hypothetical protein DCO79_13545 [Spirochaeta sp.]|nr:hypothetical protein [Spirochaeta sp.]